jgi:hypothetical protein
MNTTRLYSAAAAALLLLNAGTAGAAAITGPVKPERAPPAQQNAPAEKIAPPMNAGSHRPAETTGQGAAPDKLKPHGPGTDAHPGAQNPAGASPQNDGAASKGATEPQSNTEPKR